MSELDLPALPSDPTSGPSSGRYKSPCIPQAETINTGNKIKIFTIFDIKNSLIVVYGLLLQYSLYNETQNNPSTEKYVRT